MPTGCLVKKPLAPVRLYHPSEGAKLKWDIYLRLRPRRFGNIMFHAAVVYIISKKRKGRGVAKHFGDMNKNVFPNLPFTEFSEDE